MLRLPAEFAPSASTFRSPSGCAADPLAAAWAVAAGPCGSGILLASRLSATGCAGGSEASTQVPSSLQESYLRILTRRARAFSDSCCCIFSPLLGLLLCLGASFLAASEALAAIPIRLSGRSPEDSTPLTDTPLTGTPFGVGGGLGGTRAGRGFFSEPPPRPSG